MRIRFFNTFEPVTTFYRDLLPVLAESGIQVEAYISAAEYRDGRSKLASELNHPNLRVKYLPSFGISSMGRMRKAILMMLYIFAAAFASLVSQPVELNFFLTQPPLFALWGLGLKILRGQRYMCLIMDMYPDVAVQDGLLQRSGWLVHLLSALNRFTWNHAEAVVVIGRCMRERMLCAGIPADKVHFIPNWANEEIIFPISPEQNTLKAQLGLQDSFVILYSGNMGVSHEFQTLLAAAEQLVHEKAIRFVLIGDGSRRREIEELARVKNLDNILFLPFQPLEFLAESLSMGDVHLVTLRTGFEGLVVPSKAYGALAVGRPIIYIGEPEGEIARTVIEEHIGFVIACGDSETLTNVILNYLGNDTIRSAHGEKALDLSQTRYSRKSAMASYFDLLRGSR